jgi:ABC-2 type transport system ATP-binding protein
LALVDLQEKRKTYTVHLSGGQRQRLALGVSLVNDPELLLLDEPTTGLDPNARRSIWNILESLKSKGTTMILTTHYMEEAEHLCERIIFMNQGVFLGQGSLEELLTAHGSGDLIEFNINQELPGEAMGAIRGYLDFTWNEEAKSGKLSVENTTTALPDLLKVVENNGLLLHELQCRRPTLDDLFITLTGRHLND